MSRSMGMIPAVVTDLDDPKRLGRIKVKFDWQDDSPETFWARVAAPMAGAGRGAFFMPEKNDEVLVAFEHGSSAHAYIVGYLWSSPDKPPEDAKQTKRCIKTVLHHELLFDDDPASSSITLTTQNGYRLKLDDANKKIIVNTPDSVSIELDAAAGGTPSIKLSLPAASVTLDSTGLSVAATSVNITAPSVSINPTPVPPGVVTINGDLTVTGLVNKKTI